MANQPIQLATDVRGSGYPILCLHGHPGSGRSMSVFTTPLSRQFLTLAPDLRGYGKSYCREPFDMATHLVDLETLLDRFAIKQCLVLGWSLGGILAMELALRFPERVSGLILVATAARPWGTHPPISWQDNVFTGAASIVNWLSPGLQWNIDWLGKRSLYRYLLQQHTEIAYQYLADEGMSAYLTTSQHARNALAIALRNRYNRLTELHQIQCPALVMAGSEDRHIAPQSSKETAQNLPNSQWLEYQNVAHLFPWEIPDQVIADIYQWLSAHPTLVKPIQSDR